MLEVQSVSSQLLFASAPHVLEKLKDVLYMVLEDQYPVFTSECLCNWHLWISKVIEKQFYELCTVCNIGQ